MVTEYPRISFSETAFDFGEMYQNEAVTHFFTLRNNGTALLKIEKVKSTCGCTAAMPEATEIPPGGETKLKITFRSGTMQGRVTKHVYVDSNDPVESRVTLTVEGQVKVEVEISPSGIYVGRLGLGEIAERTVEITPVSVKDFRIESVSSDHSAVRVGDPIPRGDKEPGYNIPVTIGPVEEPGRISAKITVLTDLLHVKELKIPAYCKVVADDAEDPSQR